VNQPPLLQGELLHKKTRPPERVLHELQTGGAEMQLAPGGSILRILKLDREQAIPVHESTQTDFDPAAFLAKAGLGRRIVEIEAKQVFFAQGNPADSVFYLQKGRAKITVASERGKEATITLLTAGDFIGEESIAGAAGLRLVTATAITSCKALKIERAEMVRVMHEEHAFSDLFLKFLLARSMRTQADLIDQLFNSSEKRLARILLLMAEFGKPGEPETMIPQITQETLAEMIGTTRSRVSFFMNRFRKMGFIEYNGRIQVHKSLLNVILHDQLPDQNAEKPPIISMPRVEPRRKRLDSRVRD
jgi:CRP/FNR family cyclic AMP-dependent transcriptional regulator